MARRRRERRLQRAGAGGRADVARRRADPHASRASCGRSACPIRRTTCGRRCVKHAAIAAELVRAVPRALRSAARVTAEDARKTRGARSRPRSRTALQPGREPRRGPHPPPLRQRGAVGDPHQLLPARRRRPAEAADRLQVRQPQARRPAAAAAALRDLRLLAARRGRASALRQGRARRHPLVRPAAGFPHRGARPRQGAAGQERRDRAGRRQGRLRAEAAAASGGTREAVAGRGHRRLQALHLDACSTSPTISTTTAWSPPDNVVRHDGDDPYLVVAADKGTATFSDIANAISDEHGFWLGDAFASGGSAGYDHKKMGITARGAWEAVKRHFREMDIDIQHDAVHGRRRRRHVGRRVRQRHAAVEQTIKLVAAFDHRDIFIDPDPDPATSFAERQRLFDLPRSSWQDYDKALISTGGGIFSRSLKAIALSPRGAGGCSASTRPKATPHEVMTRDPEGAGRSAVLRRHRHLCARRRPRPTTRSATAPTMRSASPARELRVQGDRRGRQSRHDAARPHRGGAARRAAQHRRHRQFGRRQHLRRRGQHQDRAGAADARRPARRATRATRCWPR